MRVSIVFLCIVLLACQQVEIPPYASPNFTDQEPDLRPDIPRSYEPEAEVIEHEQQTIDDTPFLNQEVVPPYVGLELPLGVLLGHEYPYITSFQFPLLKHHAIHLPGSTYLTYTEEIIFDFDENTTGMIIFGEDDDEQISTFLYFENEKPIFTYAVHLNGLTWYELSGQEIKLLGNTYVIAEATNWSVSLFGIDVPSNLYFTHGEKLIVNSNKQKDTMTRVEYDYIDFTVFADGTRDDGNILLSPGERLTDNMNGFANSVLDISYEGVESLETSRFTLDQTKHGYDLIIDSFDGPIEIPFVEQDAGQLILGQIDEPLRIEECDRDECIQVDETILFNARDGRTFLGTFSGISDNPQEVIFRTSGNRYSYQFLGEPGRNAYTDIILGDVPFRAEIGAFDNDTGLANISIDFDQYKDAEIVMLGGFEVHFEDIVDNKTLPIEIEIPRELTYERQKESIFVNITFDGDWTITVAGNISFVEDDDDIDSFGLTPYGATILLDSKKRNLEENEAVELDILLPYRQVIGTVRLEG